jgi:hypothetical protein
VLFFCYCPIVASSEVGRGVPVLGVRGTARTQEHWHIPKIKKPNSFVSPLGFASRLAGCCVVGVSPTRERATGSRARASFRSCRGPCRRSTVIERAIEGSQIKRLPFDRYRGGSVPPSSTSAVPCSFPRRRRPQTDFVLFLNADCPCLCIPPFSFGYIWVCLVAGGVQKQKKTHA